MSKKKDDERTKTFSLWAKEIVRQDQRANDWHSQIYSLMFLAVRMLAVLLSDKGIAPKDMPRRPVKQDE